MNKETIITILFVLVSMNMYTQQRLIVRDSLTQKPIAYTSVWFGNEAGRYTNESGMIEIPKGTKLFLNSFLKKDTKQYKSEIEIARQIMNKYTKEDKDDDEV